MEVGQGPGPPGLLRRAAFRCGHGLVPVWALSHIIHPHATHLVPDALAFRGLQLFFQSSGMNAVPGRHQIGAEEIISV